ncbi:N-acetylmuramoyl-L-alanine amidase [Campylobacter iguaniorum]|uniref:N-acetylmuramoyl-L-alanine amidase n=1 Tax=Campylobacter iguaniorum TaxID=1244531 RepID=A0A076FBJ7_9BACT|nr:N-acetylmuramoyl-L-alanine amidase [Campylobacter iguaniorum]AII15078.1 N-acetylmuramoyl-L-alanine amidase [Campylobacter iguaniorum]ALV24904.1 N-acetylmuramoyl-L-alanine amidase [Campylobacter iguaniorum]
MGKITRLFLVFIFATFVFGANFATQIKEFDSKFDTLSKSEQMRMYHRMKNVYIQSIINDKEELKIDALIRLVQSSKALGLDYKDYEKELKTYGKLDLLDKQIKKSQATKTTKKEDTPNTKTQNIKKEIPKETAKNITNNKQTLKILSVTSDKNTLVLNLNKEPSADEIKDFELNSKAVFRQIYDIEGIAVFVSKTIKSGICDEIRISQYDKNTTRLVCSNDKKQDINFKIEKNKLIFSTTNGINNRAEEKNEKVATVKKTKNAVETPKTQDSLSTKFRRSKTIVLDPGHGGKDAGAVGGSKLYEKHIVLKVALKTGEILKDRGYKVHYTRSNDKFIGLRNRTSFANDKMADLFISVHANAAPNKQKAKSMEGIETFFLSPTRSERSMSAANLENKADTDEMNYFTKISFLNFLNREKIIASNKLAIDIQSSLLGSVRKKYSVSDGGVREAPFWVLVGASMPAVLVEIGYITHPTEGPRIANDEYISKLATGLADGVDSYFIKNR